MFNKSLFFQKSEHNVRRFNSTLRWLLVSVLIGIVVGLISGSFDCPVDFKPSQQEVVHFMM